MNVDLVLQFTRKRRKFLKFCLVKFTSKDICCKNCILQAFIHSLETFIDHDS